MLGLPDDMTTMEGTNFHVIEDQLAPAIKAVNDETASESLK